MMSTINKSFKISPTQEQIIIKAFKYIIKDAQNKKAAPKDGKK